MTIEQGAYLAEIIGVIVVVVTLIYVAIQVQQGARLLRSESRQSLVDNDREILLAYLDNIDLLDKLSGDEPLTRSEQWRFSVLWIVNMRNRELEWLQYRDGILDEATWHSYREILRFTLGSRRRREWWQVAKTAFGPDFVEMVDGFIGDTPPSDIMAEFFGGWERV